MSIAPIILRLYPELDADQREAVGHAEGPMLVIAGPGSGKTGCIHLRAVNLLLTGRTEPSELVLCTFGRDAAWQLQRRFTSSAMACGVPGNFSQVGITTIHSLCHRLLKPRATLVGLRPGYRVLDEEQQRLLLRQESGAVFGPDWDTVSRRGWRDGVHMAAEAARFFDRICDELIYPEDLAQPGRPFISALGRCCLRYRQLLLRRNVVDFAHLQVWAHRVMQDDEVARRSPRFHPASDGGRVPGHLAGADAHSGEGGGRPRQHHGGGRRRPGHLPFPRRQRGQPASVPGVVSRMPGGQSDHQLPLPPGYRCCCGPVGGRRRSVER